MVAMITIVAKLEEVKEVADGRRILGNVGIVLFGLGIGQIVAATIRDCRQVPVAFDELQNGNVVGIMVRDVAGLDVLGDHDQGNARAVAEKVQRLYISGVVIAA